jgi:hypothetical protein
MRRTVLASSGQRNKILGIFIDKDILSALSVKHESSGPSSDDLGQESGHVDIPGLTLVTGKYSSKLREKNFSPLELALRKSYHGDASLLRSARDIVNKQSLYVMSNQEMNKILNYISSRGIAGWVLMSKDEPEVYREELDKTLSGIGGINLLTEDGDDDQTIQAIQTKFQHLPPHQTLIVSQRDSIITFGNSMNHLTTRFR